MNESQIKRWTKNREKKKKTFCQHLIYHRKQKRVRKGSAYNDTVMYVLAALWVM